MTENRHEEAVLSPGDLLDHFKVIRLVGRGGMGEVYLARDTKLGRKVALKVVKPEKLHDDTAIERFMFEAKVTARFSHPHIVTVYSVGSYKGSVYVALEYLEGGSLRERIKERPGVKESLRIALAIAEALEEAHGHKILHRDLKPENVLLPRDGRIRVVDFGLAKALDAQGINPDEIESTLSSQTAALTQLSISGKGMHGTPSYMAPEQWLAEECTPATDVWALGVILYELLSGQRPYTAATAYALCAAVCREEKAPTLDGAGMPSALADLVARCLEKEGAKRPRIGEVVEELHKLLNRGRDRLEIEESPFRGLLPFSERHAELFFGRDREINAFVERLREETILPVVGPSGAGKSSFMKAGVIPRLREQGRWTVLAMRPGHAPFDELATRLIRGESGSKTSTPTKISSGPFEDDDGNEKSKDELIEELRETPGKLGMYLRELAEDQHSRILLFVDQLEELYTLVNDPKERTAFMNALCLAADMPEDAVRVVFTVRDDFLGKVAESDAAREAMSRVTVLRAPGQERMREILTRPLAYVGYEYGEESIVDEMIAAVKGEPAGLPLLQFTCLELWERRNKKERTITRSAYQAIGGVEGALAHHADSVLSGLTAEEERLAKEIFLRLVTSEGTRRTITRKDLLQGLTDADDLLDRLIQTRTITQRRSHKGSTDAELELTHESLIRTWKRLRRWLDSSREEMVFLEEITKAAELWEKRGRLEEEVWVDATFYDANRRAEQIGVPPDLVTQFLQAGRELTTRRRRRKRFILTGAVIGLAIIATVLGWMYREASTLKEIAEKERDRAETATIRAEERGLDSHFNIAVALQEKAERKLEESNPLGARVFAAAALMHNPYNPRSPFHKPGLKFDEPRSEQLFVEAYSAYWQGGHDATIRPEAVLRHDSWLSAVALTPDGKQVAAGGEGGKIVIWDVETAKVVYTLEDLGSDIWSLDFSPDGKLLAAGLHSGEVRLWRVDDYKAAGVYQWHGTAEEQLTVVFGPNSRWLASVNAASQAVVWDLEQEKLFTVSSNITGYVWEPSFSPDGRWLFAPTEDRKELVKWDLQAGRPIGRVDGGKKAKASSVSSDGRYLATGGLNQDTYVWDLESSQRHGIFREHTADVSALETLPNSKLFISAGDNNVLRLWNGESLAQEHLLEGHKQAVLDLDVTASGKLIASASRDDTVRLWKVSPSIRMERGKQPGAIAFSPDGNHLATMGNPHRILNASTREIVQEFRGWARSGAFSPDSELFATTNASRCTIVLWELSTGKQVAALSGFRHYLRNTSFSPDGNLLAGGGWHNIIVFDRHTGEIKFDVDGHSGVAFTPDSAWLATGSKSGTIAIRDAHTGEVSRSLKGHTDHIEALAFSPDGRWLASVGMEGQFRLWDMNRPGVSHTLAGHAEWINGVNFSRDGRFLITGSDDWTARVWSVESKKQVLVVRTPGPCHAGDFSRDGSQLAVSWQPKGAAIYPFDYSVRDADPVELLATAEKEAGMKLEGVSLVSME